MSCFGFKKHAPGCGNCELDCELTGSSNGQIDTTISLSWTSTNAETATLYGPGGIILSTARQASNFTIPKGSCKIYTLVVTKGYLSKTCVYDDPCTCTTCRNFIDNNTELAADIVAAGLVSTLQIEHTPACSSCPNITGTYPVDFDFFDLPDSSIPTWLGEVGPFDPLSSDLCANGVYRYELTNTLPGEINNPVQPMRVAIQIQCTNTSGSCNVSITVRVLYGALVTRTDFAPPPPGFLTYDTFSISAVAFSTLFTMDQGVEITFGGFTEARTWGYDGSVWTSGGPALNSNHVLCFPMDQITMRLA